MIATTQRAPLVLRVAAPLAWRGDRRIADKLMGFSATELGSALDMLRAAELTTDPDLRRLFMKHALDEARHAQQFRDAAKQLLGRDPEVRPWERHHALRQDLFERWGVTRFVAFVWISEAKASRQFEVLCGHFSGRPELQDLFARVGRDERYHVAYSKHLLDMWRAEGRGAEVDRALREIRLSLAWMAWRRAGRRIGELMTLGLMAALYVAVVPVFALLQRALERPQHGWRAPRRELTTTTLDDARRPF